MPTRVDLIVAVRNEEATIRPFLADVAALDLPVDVDLRVLFIEDSSTDETRAVLRAAAAANPAVGYYFVAPGFGQGPALVFGLTQSDADAMVLLDVDGSHTVGAIPRLIAGFRAGAHVVQCVRASQAGRPRHRRLGAIAFALLCRLVTSVDLRDQNIFFRLVSASFAAELLRQPRYWRSLRLPLPRADGATRYVPIDSPERTLGSSKYGLWSLLALALDGMLVLISPRRLAALTAAVSLVAVLAAAAGSAWFSGALVLAVAAVLGRRAHVERPDILARMQVIECARPHGSATVTTGDAAAVPLDLCTPAASAGYSR